MYSYGNADELVIKRKAVIFDLDGTLCDNQCTFHIYKDVNGKVNWPAWYAQSYNFPENTKLVNMLFLYKETGYKIIIMTARKNTYWDVTYKYLCKILHYDNLEEADILLIMAEEDDPRHDYEMKEERLKNIREYYTVEFAIDDRQQVVDMFRRNDVLCLQCAPGNF